MNARSPLAALVAATLAIAPLPAQGVEASAAKSAPKTLALLVGIDNYLQPAAGRALPKLQGARNDIARARDLLIERFGFAPESIVTLLDADATHEAIVRHFHDHLIARAGADTEVVFWFSGHGSRVPDASGADTSSRDEGDAPKDDTMIAYDSRVGARNGEYDVTDDELYSLLAQLRSRHVLVVADCCHSASLVRGAPVPGVRYGDEGEHSLDTELLAPFWPKEIPLVDDDNGVRTDSAVFLAACGSRQEAGECEVAGQVFGTMTWFLTSTLREADAHASWRSVAETVRARVAGQGTKGDQLVAWQGPVDAPIFGGIGKQLPPGFLLLPDLWIDAGRIHGIVEGTTLRAVDLDGQERGELAVERANAANSKLRWKGPAARPRGIPLRVRPIAGLAGRSPLRVHLDGVDAALLESCPWAAVATDASDYELGHRGDMLEFCSADGTLRRLLPADKAAVQDAMFHEHCFRSLWEGIAQPGRYRIDVRVAPATAAQLARIDHHPPGRPPTAALIKTQPDAPRALVGASALLREEGTGRYVEIVVTNRSDDDVYVTVLSVSENHDVNVIWGRDGDNQLAPGQSNPCLVEVGPDPSWRQDRPMVDRYVVIATPRRADFQAFESHASLDAAAPKRGGDNPLPAFLAGALYGGATRGDPGPPNWGVTWYDLALVLPEQFAAAAKR